MVFLCRCFSLSFFFEEEEIEYETTSQAKSTSYYTTSSGFNLSLLDSEAEALVFSNLAQKPSNLRVFTYPELKAATKDFDVASIIGEGGLGLLYRGVIKSLEHPFNKIQVAVRYTGGELQDLKTWANELSLLGVAKHPNLVQLVGYGIEDNGRRIPGFLVYEYMPNRSVEYHLSTRSEVPLSWTMRLKLAQDVARGLTYLHEEMDFQIIFGDFKSSNILLDDQWNAKLLDFGLAQLGHQEGITHAKTVCQGYAAPEYNQTGNLTSKGNIWSYGVFLYELITGRHPLDKNRPMNEQMLLKWVKPYLDDTKFQQIVDPRLEGMYSLESAQKLSIIANTCLSKNPDSRPKMSEVLEMVNQLIGVPSQATNPAPPPKSLARAITMKLKKSFMCGRNKPNKPSISHMKVGYEKVFTCTTKV